MEPGFSLYRKNRGGVERPGRQVIVVIKFSDADKIGARFGSNACEPFIPIRESAADMQMTSYRSIG